MRGTIAPRRGAVVESHRTAQVCPGSGVAAHGRLDRAAVEQQPRVLGAEPGREPGVTQGHPVVTGGVKVSAALLPAASWMVPPFNTIGEAEAIPSESLSPPCTV